MSISWLQEVIKGKVTHLKWNTGLPLQQLFKIRIFSYIPADNAQSPLLDIPPKAYIPNKHDIQLLSKDYVFIVLQILMKHMKFFRHYQHIASSWKLVLRTVDCDINTKIVIVPMTIMCKNEQSYADVVEILDSYGDHIADVYRKKWRKS